MGSRPAATVQRVVPADRDEPQETIDGVPQRRVASRTSPRSRSASSSGGSSSGRSSSRSCAAKPQATTSASGQEFVFYDGPPFANGLPHYGHLLTGFVKDAVPRYQTMRGKLVHRRFGWDCHGLPAEVEAERELGIAGHPEITAVRHRQLQRRLPHERAALHRRVGALRHAPGPLGRLRERLQDARSRLHGERHVGVQDALGQGPRVRGIQGAGVLLALRDAAEQHRDADGRRLLRPPGPGAHGRLRAASTTAASRPARCCSPGRRRRGRCRRTSPSPSAPTSTTPSSSRDGQATDPRRGAPRALRRRARRGAGSRDRHAVGAGRAPLPAAVRLLRRRRAPRHRRSAFQVLAADFVATEDGTGIVHMAPGFGEDDQIVANAAGIPTIVPMDEHGRYTARRAAVGRRAGVRRQPGRHPPPQGAQPRAPPRDLQPLVPALLALLQAARLPRHLVVVRRRHEVPRPHGRAQRGDHLGAQPRQARQLRQVAGERPRLVDQPQPLLGLADPGVAQRRPALPAHRRLRLDRRARGATSASRSTTSTGRRSTSWCARTPTTRRAGR